MSIPKTLKFIALGSLLLKSMALIGCQSSMGSSDSFQDFRRSTHSFQEAIEPVIPNSISRSVKPRNNTGFMLPRKRAIPLELSSRSSLPDLGLQNELPEIKRTSPAPKKIFPPRYSSAKLSKRDTQYLLQQLGFYKGKIDGAIGPQSVKAIKAFQRSQNLTVDGVAGKNTKQALIRMTRKKYENNYQTISR